MKTIFGRAALTALIACSCSMAWAESQPSEAQITAQYGYRTNNNDPSGWTFCAKRFTAQDSQVEVNNSARIFVIETWEITNIDYISDFTVSYTRVKDQTNNGDLSIWAFPYEIKTDQSFSKEQGLFLDNVKTVLGVYPGNTIANGPLAGTNWDDDKKQRTATLGEAAISALKSAGKIDNGTLTVNVLITTKNSSSNFKYIPSSFVDNQFAITQYAAYNSTERKGYATLSDALTSSSITDKTKSYDIVLCKDVELSSRIIPTIPFTLSSAAGHKYSIKRANGFTNALALCTNGNSFDCKFSNLRFDGNNVSTTFAFLAAENKTVTLENVDIVNAINTNGNCLNVKNNGGALYLKNVSFDNCSATTGVVANNGRNTISLEGEINYSNITGSLFYISKYVINQGITTVVPLTYESPAEGEVVVSNRKGNWALYYDKFDITNQEYRLAIEPGSPNGDMKLAAAPKFELSAEVPYATFCVDYNARIPEGVKAYKATSTDRSTSTDGSTITFQRITGNIPANEGVVLYGNAGTYTLQTASSADAINDNILLGKTTATTAPPNCYAMSKNQSRENHALTFAPVAEGFSLPANKAYIVDTSSAPLLRFNFDVETDEIPQEGIETSIVAIETKAEAGVRYDLSGRRVNGKAAGFVIEGGKKLFIK